MLSLKYFVPKVDSPFLNLQTLKLHAFSIVLEVQIRLEVLTLHYFCFNSCSFTVCLEKKDWVW